jgi:hypothetical protein
MGKTAAGIPPLGDENVCIPCLFANARRDAPGDGLKRHKFNLVKFNLGFKLLA